MNLETTIKRLEALNLPEPKPICWVKHDGEYHFESYCPSCAKKVLKYLIHDCDKSYLGDDYTGHAELPTWSNCNIDNTFVHKYSSRYVSDVNDWCVCCGQHLDIRLTEHGVKRELEHFERCIKDDRLGLKNEDKAREVLREIYDVLWSVEYSIGTDYKYYDRVVELAKNIRPIIAFLEAIQ